MNDQALRGLLILAGAFLLGFLVFLNLVPGTSDGAPHVDPVFFATIVAGTYALTTLAGILVVRGVLGHLVDLAKPNGALRMLCAITDPLIALCAPVTPDFIEPPWRPFAAAFWLFLLMVLCFGFGPVRPLWLYVLLAAG